jgi:hypothetical protein
MPKAYGGPIRALLAATAALVALAAAPLAEAKSFSLAGATVAIDVEPNGTLAVSETITFTFDGSFSGAFREIPLRPGEAITDVEVSEYRRPYVPGASAEIGSSGDPNTFGTMRIDDGIRIVWHYRAENEVRQFTIRYRLAGSQSPTTTSWTSTSRSGATSGKSASRPLPPFSPCRGRPSPGRFASGVTPCSSAAR